ncbi:hypothetical protein KAI87_09430, partial [Myxococcota bacterium]|nr:hypothetical protein [Myxococcota bacterium]
TTYTQETKLVPVHLDLAEALSAGPDGFIPKLWTALVQALSAPRVCHESRPDFPRPTFGRGTDPWKEFQDAARTLFTSLSGTACFAEYALFLDNGDTLFRRRGEELALQLAELVQADELWKPRAVIIAGGRLVREHLLERKAALQKLRLLFLGSFNETETDQLIKIAMPTAEEDDIKELKALSGRHPWVLKRLLAEMSTADISPGDAAIKAKIDLEALFFELWNHFDLERGVAYSGAYVSPEHALMQFALDHHTSIKIKEAEHELGLRPLREYMDFLEFAGLVEKRLQSDSTIYNAHFHLWNVWYSTRVAR